LLLRCNVEDMLKLRANLVKDAGISWGEVGKMTTEEIQIVVDNLNDRLKKKQMGLSDLFI